MFDHTDNDFAILGVTPQFPVDRALLDEAYRNLQRRYHPDRFLQEDLDTQQRATLYASQINDAYRRLKNPIDCAESFFSIRFEGNLLETVTGKPEFLFHMLDMGEQIESALEKKDAQALNQLSAQIQKEIDLVCDEVKSGFEQNAAERVAISIAHWKYLRKNLDNLADHLDGLAFM